MIRGNKSKKIAIEQTFSKTHFDIKQNLHFSLLNGKSFPSSRLSILGSFFTLLQSKILKNISSTLVNANFSQPFKISRCQLILSIFDSNYLLVFNSWLECILLESEERFSISIFHISKPGNNKGKIFRVFKRTQLSDSINIKLPEKFSFNERKVSALNYPPGLIEKGFRSHEVN